MIKIVIRSFSVYSDDYDGVMVYHRMHHIGNSARQTAGAAVHVGKEIS